MSESIGTAPRRQRWMQFGVAALAAFMATLDSSIVNVALPSIAGEFKADVKTAAWVVQGYLLTTMALLLIGGRLLDLWGARRVFAGGFIFFTLGSVFCGAAGSIGMLVGARAFQGIGAAVLMSCNQGLIGRAFPPEQRGRTLGMIGTVVSLGLASGPPLGGLLIGVLGWRSIFYVNIPVGVLAVLVSLRWIEAHRRRAAAWSFDWAGAAMTAVGLAALFVGLDLGEDRGWGDALVLALIAFSLVVLVLFLRNESAAAHPLLNLSIFNNRFFSQSCAAAFLAFFAMIAAMILTPFYLQDVRGFAPETVGLVMMSMPAAMLVVAPLAGWISDRIGSGAPATLGLVLTGCGLLLLSGIGAATGTAAIVRNLAFIGLGMGFFGSPNSSAILSSVPRAEMGAASGLSALMRTAGIAFGTAFAATAFTFFRNRAAAGAAAADPAGFDLAAFGPVFVMAACIAGLNVINSAARGRRAPDQ